MNRALQLTFFLALTLAAATGCKTRQEKVFNDIRYAERRSELTVDDPDQDRLLDLYLPETAKPAGGYPVFVFVHGGGFSGGNKDLKGSNEAMFSHLRGHGYAVVSVNYYLFKKNNPLARTYTMDNPLPEMMASEDLTLALRWIWDEADRYGLNRDAVCLCGGSAGGMAVLSTAYLRQPTKPSVKAIVNLWGGISNIALIRNPEIPILTLYGDQDPHFEILDSLRQQMEKIGNQHAESIVMEGHGHAEYRYVGENRMDEVIDFLDRSLSL